MSALDRVLEYIVDWRNKRQMARFRAQEARVRAKVGNCSLKDSELIYAAYARCKCGAGLAYARGIGMNGFWDCSDILTGRAAPAGHVNSAKHSPRYPFIFFEIKSEQQPSANGATTRPK